METVKRIFECEQKPSHWRKNGSSDPSLAHMLVCHIGNIPVDAEFKGKCGAMLTTITDGILCCLTGKSADVLVPVETLEPGDGMEFVEVKPGRVLRVRHIVPERPVIEPVSTASVSVHCKRRISLYRDGQLVIENLGDVLHCPGGGAERNSTLELELSDYNSNATPPAPVAPPPAPVATPPAPPPRQRRRKPKRSVMIDTQRSVSSCKGGQSDLALFFLHGVGGSLHIWGRQLDFFSRLGYEVIAPDLAGHGASSAPRIAAAYTFYALAEDLRAIFKRYARKRNILIGHSYGVSFCTFLAHEYPEQVHKVVMINGGGPTALEPSLCSIFNLPACLLHCLSPFLAWSFLKAAFAQQGAREKQLLKDGNAFNVSSFVLRAMMSGQYWPEGDEVYHAELTTPILLLHGAHDKFVPMEEDQRMAEILLMAFLKVIEEGSHMVMLECPDTVNTLLHEFFLWEPDASYKQNPAEPGPPKSKPAPPNGTPAPPNSKPVPPNRKSAPPNGKRVPPNRNPASPNGTPGPPNRNPAPLYGKPTPPKSNPAPFNSNPAHPNSNPTPPNSNHTPLNSQLAAGAPKNK
ncbi:protein ABHD8-like isoform X3 [Anguilla anguilla]|uniref:protein ABHD8-like isoform X3 n=2 Tax=Anguilla anguilla TaxID=7936 RepID=UPI0015A7B27E|nr:protein ABHD8-like isoform X3 [Anguilla anguilla]